MRLIVGLGNPGLRYASTRHNIGFKAIDLIAQRFGIAMGRRKYEAIIGEGAINSQPVLLMKPQTYMNLSGKAVRAAAAYYKLTPEEIIVIYDDLSLDIGRLRVRQQGSAGGHNGIKSIIDSLQSQTFPRIRLGVGPQPLDMDAAEFVLDSFAAREWSTVKAVLDKNVEVLASCLDDGAEVAMNKYNAWRHLE